MTTYNHISVPIEMFIDAQQKGYGYELQFFLSLKLMYKNGKVKFTNDELNFIEFVEQIYIRKTTKKYITFLMDLNWIKYNSKTGYYILSSFDKIREKNNWFIRLAFPINYNTYHKTKAVTGAIIFGYLHRDFWRKVKRNKSVQLKGCTYNFISPKYNFKDQPAPVSVLGANKIYNISKSTLSRLKKMASDEKFIKVKKNYSVKDIIQSEAEFFKMLFPDEIRRDIVFHNKKYSLQLIDTVYPLFHFTKRNSVGTYLKGFIRDS